MRKLPIAKMAEVGNPVPSSILELGTRLARVVALYPSRRAAAKICERTDEMLARYEKGLADPPFSVVAKLALDKGVSLEWLATGEGPMERGASPAAPPPAPLDSALMQDCVALVLESINERGVVLANARFVECVLLLYELAIEVPNGDRRAWLDLTGKKTLRLAG